MTLLATLGEGGMATVYLASVGQENLTRLAAVKLLRPGLPDHDYRTRFMDEAKLVLRLHHNNIVDVREAGEIDEQLFIVMALIEGRDLADIWDRCAQVGKAFPVPLAVHIVREILRGLHYAHTFPGLGLVHRDVSPSNILIDWQGAVRLADFGLATSTLKASLTAPGVVFGKVGYMSPEQARREVLDGRTDVYACGAVLWELLTGRPLRAGEGIDTEAVANFEAPPPSSLSSRVDPLLDAVVVKALTHDRDERYPTAGEFMEALSDWLAGHAAGTGQEQVGEFLAMLFGDAQLRERENREKLLSEISRTEVFPHASESSESGDEFDVDVDELEDASESDSGPKKPEEKPDPTDIEHIESGTIIAERYRIINRIGRGGMGTVYLGEHTTVGRQVAIKVLTHQWSRNELVAKRFRAEARAASAAGHPNIIEVFDAGELPDGRLYLVMEYLTGRNLYDEIQDLGTLPVGRACRIIRAVGRAIRAAHDVGIIHRDLKPDNVMFVPLPEGEGETVKVLDFGISAGAERSESQARLTVPGHALGTPEYMAPEQAKGKDATEAFDLYALGVMLYECLVGEPPFISNNLVEIMARKSTEAAPSLGEKRPDLPRNLVSLVDDCLEIDPVERPKSARDFLVRMDEVLRSLPPEERDDGFAPSTVAPIIKPTPEESGPRSHSGPEDAPIVDPVDSGNARKLGYGAVLLLGIILLVWGMMYTPEKTGPGPGPVAVNTSSGDSKGRTSAAESGEVRTTVPDSKDSGEPDATGGVVPDPTNPSGPDPTVAPNPTAGDSGKTPGDSSATPTSDTEGDSGNDSSNDAGNDSNDAGNDSSDDSSGDTDESGDSGDSGDAGDSGGTKPTKRPPKPSPDSAACKQTVAAANEARSNGDFRALLVLLKDRHCWKSKKEHKILRTLAYKETMQFARCVQIGKSVNDDRVRRWVNICEKRLAKENQ
ncbi:MAG: protein kinase [Myxococcales bacterium]|nr:protein kinase [Myxococcales bacterium]MCB9754818.1 protein kinase [Myxococcales bacterium]